MNVEQIIKENYIKVTEKARIKSLEYRRTKKKIKQDKVLNSYKSQNITNKKDFIAFCKAESAQHQVSVRTIQNWLGEYNIRFSFFNN